MSRSLKLLLATLALALTGAAPALAQSTVSTPEAKTLYQTGPSGRFLVDGPWLFRLDDANKGLGDRFFAQASTSGWSRTTVPNAWNAGDTSDKSFAGSVGWYRKDLRLPSAAKDRDWIVRFESVNYRSRVWLNGTEIGQNTGAYLPFELRLPAAKLKRGGVNRLVVRVENKRKTTDFPPSGLSASGTPTGGWWNYGGLLREVYLRQVDRLDMSAVRVVPNLPNPSGAATVTARVTVRNLSTSPARTRLSGTYGTQALDLGVQTIPPVSSREFTKTIRIARPRLWAPGSPNLYPVRLAARVGDTVLQRWFERSGIRSIKVVDGTWLLNGRKLDVRGFGLHEDDPKVGFAIGNDVRKRQLDEVQEAGATMIRAHYPLHPYYYEQADERGILMWSEIPVYALKTEALAKTVVRKLAAKEMAQNILVNGSHPSVVVWSVGNELSSRPGPAQTDYIRRAAGVAKSLDPTRPVGYAVAAYPAAGCQATAYAPLDVLGINDYFGWYPGPNGQIADRDLLSGYLDSVHACYPKKAVLVSEFGAEANRPGPVEEKGTYAFQQDFINFRAQVYAAKPWLAGSIYWALEEFKVRPNWDGGNPRPSPPLHQKAVIALGGAKKPAYADLQRFFKATQQIGPVPGT